MHGDDDDAIGHQLWLGWDSAGRVERLGPESIATRFFCVVVPVHPGRTFYEHERGRFEIPRHRTSVVLGYLRTPMWLAATILTAGGVFAFERWAALLPVGGACALVAALLTFVLGRLGPEERDRRELLRRVMGLGAPPELLPPTMCEELRAALADTWFHTHHIDWRDAIARGDASEMLVALAEYHGAATLVTRARTNLIASAGN